MLTKGVQFILSYLGLLSFVMLRLLVALNADEDLVVYWVIGDAISCL